MQEKGWSSSSIHAIYFATRSKIHPRAYSAKQGYNCTVPRGFPTFHANRGLSHIALCLQRETRSIITRSITVPCEFPQSLTFFTFYDIDLLRSIYLQYT